MAKRNLLTADFREPVQRGMIWNRDELEVSLHHAEVYHVRFKRFRPIVRDASDLRKLMLPHDWHTRLTKLLHAGAISYVYYSAKIGLGNGLELGLPSAQSAERPTQFRRLRTHWNDGNSPLLQLGCLGRLDTSGRWLSIHISPPLLFNAQSAWQEIECSQFEKSQLPLLSIPGQAFIHCLLGTGAVTKVVITPMTKHYCDVSIASLHATSHGSQQVLAASAQALENVLGLALLD